MGYPTVLKKLSLQEDFRFDIPSQVAEDIKDALTRGYMVLVFPTTNGLLVQFTLFVAENPSPYYLSQVGFQTTFSPVLLSHIGANSHSMRELAAVLDSGYEAYLVPEKNWANIPRFKLVHFGEDSD